MSLRRDNALTYVEAGAVSRHVTDAMLDQQIANGGGSTLWCTMGVVEVLSL